MKNILITAYSFVAAIIGAGFASGQEILCYFSVFGHNGIIGILLSCIVFAVFTFAVYSVCVQKHIYTYCDFIETIPHHFLRKTIHILTGVFSFAVYSVMLAASGQIFKSVSGLNAATGALLCTIICSVLFCRGNDKVFDFNGILGIVLTAGIVISCLYILRYREFHVFISYVKPVTNSFTYAGYNLITTTPVLVNLSRRLHSKKEVIASSLISSFALFIIMLLIFGILTAYINKINLGQFPMLTMALRQNKLLGLLYGFLLITAIATTMLSSGGSVCETFNLNKKPFKIWITGFLAYFVSGFGFSKLINSAYRICGIIGFIICLSIVFYCFKILFKKLDFYSFLANNKE